jgi:hypothetical protein
MDASSDDSDAEIQQQVFPPAELPLDHDPEAPQEKHVADQVEPVVVEKIICHPFERMQSLSVADLPAVGLSSKAGGQKYHHVDADQNQRHPRPVVNRRVSANRDNHRNCPPASASGFDASGTEPAGKNAGAQQLHVGILVGNAPCSTNWDRFLKRPTRWLAGGGRQPPDQPADAGRYPPFC